MTAPPDDRAEAGVIVTVIVTGNGDRESLVEVAYILVIQRVGRVLGVAGDKELAAAARHGHVHARLLAFGEEG